MEMASGAKNEIDIKKQKDYVKNTNKRIYYVL